ncbi:MAG TPA: DNA-directed DNA polymerase II small subunit [Candidatus Acidoferrum sp.]|nr:DNA-directed DNA polymerase II small subunit [Candidatus Acidoferrum sp.]
MAGKDVVKELSSTLSQARILLAGDVDSSLLKEIDINTIVTRLIELHKNDLGISVASRDEIISIIGDLSSEKTPVPVEIVRKSGFNPTAAEIDAEYRIFNKERLTAEGNINDFIDYFKSRLEKVRRIISERRSGGSFSANIEVTKSYTSGREVTIVGMVSSKITTKKGNIMVVVEDETSDLKVIFMNGSSQQSRALFESSKNLINDEVVAIKGKLSNQFLMANAIVWPDIPIKEVKRTHDDIGIAFMSDIHVGSRQFLEKNFSKMLKWLNGEAQSANATLAGKIKYIIMAGDVADGVGIYPDHERELAIPDIYLQYKLLFNFIETIPDYIHVFVMPGNHDAVGRAEPQPPIGEELFKDFKRDNVHMVTNPSFMTLHGIDVLSYHGTSLDSMIRALPDTSYSAPEKAMVELLKRRHLSPIYGGNVVVPSKEDQLVIDKVPDILHMGHIHKNGLAEYHGVKIVNSGTWQGSTALQVRSGHMPTPCILPVYEGKQGTFTSVNFDGAEAWK